MLPHRCFAALLLALILHNSAPADDAADYAAARARAEQFSQANQFDAAAREYERAVEFATRAFGEAPATSEVLNNLGLIYHETADYDKGDAVLRRALAIREAKYGPNSAQVAQTSYNLARLSWAASRYADAAPLYARCLRIDESLFGPNHLEVATDLNSLGLLYVAMGDYAKAEPIYLRSLKIRETQRGPAHPEVGECLNNLAILYQAVGLYPQAEALFERCIKIDEQALGPNHPSAALNFNNIAILYKELGQFAKAEAFYRRALKINETVLGPEHPKVADNLHNLGYLFHLQKDYARAEPLYEKSLALRERKLGPEHLDVSYSLNNLAMLYADQKQYAKAESLYRRSVSIREAKLGPTHHLVARTLGYLAILSQRLGRLDEADALFQRSLKLRENAFGPDHHFAAELLAEEAQFDTARGEFAAAVDRFERARRIMRKHIARTLPALSARDQLAFLEQIDRPILESALSIALLPNADAARVERTAGWLANGKAVAFDALANRVQLGRDALDPQLKAAAERLSLVRSDLAALATKAAEPGKEAARNTRLETLQAEERALAKTIASGRGETAADDPWVSSADIRGSLSRNSVLIDLVRFKLDPHRRPSVNGTIEDVERSAPHYVAWLTPAAGASDVRVIDLGLAEPIDQAVAMYQSAIAAAQSGEGLKVGEVEAEAALAKPLAEISRLVLAPLWPHVRDAEEWILSPDAGLWLVPWAALPTDKERYAVEGRALRFVSAGREVALEQRRTSPVKAVDAWIFANPDYGLKQPDAWAAYTALFYRGVAPPAMSARPANDLGASLTRRSAGIGNAAQLPFTAVEAELAAPRLKEWTKQDPPVYLERYAQEATVKSVRSPRVLLLSTHGYFLPDQHSDAAAAEGAAPLIDADGRPLENPLLRCGLLFAGCNERERYSEPRLGDGVLTGLEIVGCDFRGTELVVLSACETGLGQISNGEGVAGLRQAFQLAGARSVVSTLWQIPDRQSAVLMSDFFTHLAAGKSKAESLRSAQLAMIKSRREKFGAAHPLYWAAWTLTGN